MEVITITTATVDYLFFHLIATPSEGDIRLVGDRDDGKGLVEYYNRRRNEWVPVCPDPSWDDNVAAIACSQLGYGSGSASVYR